MIGADRDPSRNADFSRKLSRMMPVRPGVESWARFHMPGVKRCLVYAIEMM
jgi:hypothetical protein